MSACVGCGYCCKKAPCCLGYEAMLKRHLIGSGDNSAPCRLLVFKDGRHWCQLVLEATDQQISKELAIGAGCCSSLNSERRKYIRRDAA